MTLKEALDHTLMIPYYGTYEQIQLSNRAPRQKDGKTDYSTVLEDEMVSALLN